MHSPTHVSQPPPPLPATPPSSVAASSASLIDAALDLELEGSVNRALASMALGGDSSASAPRAVEAPPPGPPGLRLPALAHDSTAATWSLVAHLDGALGPAAASALLQRSTTRTLEAGEVLWHRGDSSEAGVCIVSNGMLGAYNGSPGSRLPSPSRPRTIGASGMLSLSGLAPSRLTEQPSHSLQAELDPELGQLLYVLSAGSVVGDDGVLSGGAGTRLFPVAALTRCELVQIDAAACRAFMRLHPEAAVSAFLSGTLRNWRDAQQLLVGSLKLFDAFVLSHEPPGCAPPIVFSDAPPAPLRTVGVLPQDASAGMVEDVLVTSVAAIEAAADAVRTFLAGDVIFSAGMLADSVYVVTSGFAVARISASSTARLCGVAGQEALARVPGGAFDAAGLPCGGLSRAAPPGFPEVLSLPGADVRPSLNASNVPLTVRAIGPGSIAGGPACLSGGCHTATLVAATHCTVAAFHESSFRACLTFGTLVSAPDSDTCFDAQAPVEPAPLRSRVLALVAVAVVRSLSPLLRLQASMGFTRLRALAGEVLYHRGDDSDGIYFILSGRVRCEAAHSGASGATPHVASGATPPVAARSQPAASSVLSVEASRGEMLGELSFMARDHVRDLTAIALRDTELIFISNAAIQLLIAAHPEVVAVFASSFAKRSSRLMRLVLRTMALSGGSGSTSSGVEERMGIPFSLPATPALTVSMVARRRGGMRAAAAWWRYGAGHVELYLPPPPAAPQSAPSAAWRGDIDAVVAPNLQAPHIVTIAVVAAGAKPVAGALLAAFSRRLAAALARVERGAVALVTRASFEARMGGSRFGALLHLPHVRTLARLGLADLEEMRFVVLVGEEGGGEGSVAYPWSTFVATNCDLVLCVGDARDGDARSSTAGEAAAALSPEEAAIVDAPVRRELVLLHAPGVAPRGTRAWLNARRCTWHHHVTLLTPLARAPSDCDGMDTPGAAAEVARAAHDPEVCRIARFLCGRAVAVVLGGGGARGIAHMGLLRSLEARGVPVDLIGGSSQGAFMGALWALHGDSSRVAAAAEEFASRVFPSGCSLASLLCRTLTLPLVSLFDGRHMDELINRAMGVETQIEDLPTRFYCCTLNVTDGALAMHTVGPLAHFLRASTSVLGLFPPVYDAQSQRILIDGAYASNLPIECAHALAPRALGLTIACDVESKENDLLLLSDVLSGSGPRRHRLSGWWVLWLRLRSMFGGRRLRIPTTSELYDTVAYVHHNAAIRSTLAQLNPNVDIAKGGESAATAAADGGDEDDAATSLAPGPLMYIRPRVAHFPIGAYKQCAPIIASGAAAAESALSHWESLGAARLATRPIDLERLLSQREPLG